MKTKVTLLFSVAVFAPALAAALTSSANAAAVALFDFGSSRGTATAQNFINTGMSLLATTDTVTLVDNTKLGGVTNNTPVTLGSGISLSIDSTANAFTYGNSPWTGNTNVNLMGDAWLFNGLGATGFKTLTLSGLSSALQANTTYRIYFVGSYSGAEFSKFGALTYDGINYGDRTGPGVVGSGAGITNASSTSVFFDITTGSSVADALTFTIGKGAGATGGAAGVQGFAIVAVPEPSALLFASASGLLLCFRRRKS